MSASRKKNDVRLMRAALGLARRNLGQVWPNPAVGCLIVGEGSDGRERIVGRGWTGIGGRPHAETEALAQAGDAARGATVYVTLEPCSHHGETPPCAEALIAAGVARVVSALEDPDPRVSGAGHAGLRDAGIEVTVGPCAEEAAELNRGFITRVRHGRPHVTVKLAQTADGMIAVRPGIRTRITGGAADQAVHMMRATSDAVMVGAGTWRTDDPELTCRLPGMPDRSPVRVVPDARLELAAGSRLVATAAVAPLWILTGQRVDAERARELEVAGATMIKVAESEAGLDIAAVLRTLAGHGITRLLVEGGVRLAERLLSADLVDEAVIFTSRDEIGPKGLPGPPSFDDDGRFVLVSSDGVGADTRRVFRRKR